MSVKIHPDLPSMQKSSDKPVIGIVGAIGSGKSTVAAEFGKLGCAVIDADKMVHELLEQAQVRNQLARLFGESVLNGCGRIDRGKLAEQVFADRTKLLSLQAVIHPPVLARAGELIEKYRARGDIKAIVLDMPLLLEVGWQDRCDRLVFVDCKPQIIRKRAGGKRPFDENDRKIRENFQISLYNKRTVADNIVDNNSDLSILARQVGEIFSSILEAG